MLNSFFTNCFNAALPPFPTESMAEALTNDNMEDLLCTEKEVLQLLNNIDKSKACGPDKISGKMLKMTAHSIASSVTKLFNQSITTNTFPKCWKLSSVVPIPKNSDLGNPANYRPISLRPILSKLLEQIISFC